MSAYFTTTARPVLLVVDVPGLRAVESNLFTVGMIARIALGNFYEWSPTNTQPDDGINVIKPNDILEPMGPMPGRWLIATLGTGGGGGGAPTKDDKRLTSAVTAGNESPTGLFLSHTPIGDRYVTVIVNGLSNRLGDGTKVGVDCYFSSDAGVTAKLLGQLVAGDQLVWNGVVAGFDLDAADVVDLDYDVGAPAIGATVTTPVRNETGTSLPKGTLLSVTGFSVPEARPLVQSADKDNDARRPAIGILTQSLPNLANGEALVSGTLVGVNTSAFANTDQLVLGNMGAFIRPPPDNSPFTGEVQNIGSVSRVHATDGEIVVSLDGLNAVTAPQIFALAGTNGAPGPTNKYVTDSDPRNTNARAPTAHAAAHLPAGSDPLATAAPGTIQVGDAASAGAAASFANSAHVHALPAPGAPVDVATANSTGASPNVARQDHAHRASLLQTTFTEVTVDTTTTSVSPTFVDLLTQAITIQAGSVLLVHVSFSATNSSNGDFVNFRVTIDGVAKRGGKVFAGAANKGGSGAIVLRVTGLAAGARTVKVQWDVSGGTGQVRPATSAIDGEHCSLMLQEVIF